MYKNVGKAHLSRESSTVEIPFSFLSIANQQHAVRMYVCVNLCHLWVQPSDFITAKPRHILTSTHPANLQQHAVCTSV